MTQNVRIKGEVKQKNSSGIPRSSIYSSIADLFIPIPSYIGLVTVLLVDRAIGLRIGI